MKAWAFLAVALTVVAEPAMAGPEFDFVVAPEGRDGWSGKLAKHDPDYKDGPFRSLARAREAVRKLSRDGRKDPIRILVREGTYFLEDPLVFTPEDSGTAAGPVVYAAWPGERPVISGGIRIGGWIEQPDGGLRARVPDFRGRKLRFCQLFVNGQRRYRPRLPRDGYLHVAKGLSPSPQHAERGYDRLGYAPGDIPGNLGRPDEVEVLVFHNWFMSRMRIAGIDRERRVVFFTGPTANKAYWADLSRGRRYILENVREELRDPGQWHLDAELAVVAYVPMKKERKNEIDAVAPRLKELVVLKGDVEGRKWVEHLSFRGLVFAHTNYELPEEGYSWAQAESNLGGAITAEGARNCAIEDCEIAHTGAYAIEWGARCRDNRVERCTMHDLGAGGVKIGKMHWHPSEKTGDPEFDASGHVVRDCTIAHAGRVHPAAVGVWIGHAAHNVIEHNDIHDLYYTAVSVGWSWGYGDSGAHHNRIADNHMHAIGQAVLTDMGGIYTLGISPGTVLEGNVMHDIESYDYGGWGIYYDEGSTGVVARNNLVYRTKSGGFHQHYGRDNVVENNILAFAREAQLIRTRAEDHRSFTVRRNIVIADRATILGGNWSGTGFEIDSNLYWDAGGEPAGPRAGTTWEDWRAQGYDLSSVIADPGFRNAKKGDFRLKKGSPAERIGFVPFDYSRAGRRGEKPDLPPVSAAYPPGERSALPAMPLDEDFEDAAPGAKAPDATTFEDNEEATARVSEDTAASGKRSLKFVKSAKGAQPFNPHVHFNPEFASGTLVGSFAVRVEPGAVFNHEWRDVFPGQSPWYRAGPSLTVEKGRLKANGTDLGEFPEGKWVRIEIVCPVGPRATGEYDLVVTPAGGAAAGHKGLNCEGKLKRLKWFGFIAFDARPGTAFYLDEVSLAERR